MIVCLASFLLERIHIDDPVGAVPVHFFNGIWGLLSVGIFADAGASSAGWNGVDGPVTGLLFGGGTQILAQLLEVASIFVVVGGLSFLFFKLLAAMRLLRSEPAHELMGLDMPGDGRPGLQQYRRAHARRAHLTRQVPRGAVLGRRGERRRIDDQER